MKLTIAAFGLLAAISCPQPPGPPPSPTPVATPTPSPEPSATPSPTVFPTPSPAATPTPTPSPTPAEAVCVYRPLGTCVHVPPEPSSFRDLLTEAQHEAAAAGFVVAGKVTSEKAYTDEVARRLRLKGVCARNGREGGHTSDDEAWLQSSTESHNFDIVTGTGEPWQRLEARCKAPMSHTFATLEVSPPDYDEIKGLLSKAGYGHAFTPTGAIDMHGIGLTRANICYGFNAAEGMGPCSGGLIHGRLTHMVWDRSHARDARYTCEGHHAQAVRRAKLEGLEVEPL